MSARRTTATLIAAALIAGNGCEPADDGRTAEPGGADTDADSDSDGDSDADGDTCDPGEVWCNQNWVSECQSDGASWTQIEDCGEQGLLCAAGECVDTSQQCADAINEHSYIGCEYYGVTLANGVASTYFHYAVAIANAGGDEAHVVVSDGAAISQQHTVPPDDMIVIESLPWKLDIKEPGSFLDGTWATRKVANAAYRITSDRPVTVYQFSPLHYCTGACANLETDFSYTNDASLLLPAHIYRDEYIAVSRATLKVDDGFGGGGSDPGFVAIVGPAQGPTTVEITTSAFTAASDAVSNASFPALSPGQSFQVTIEPFEVFQLVAATETGCTGQVACEVYYCCDTPDTYDLTGTEIRVVSGRNPAVFGGTECSFVPFDKWACDHLEQQMFPRETWGSRYVCAHNETQASAEPTVWRILSGSDGNQIEFQPSSAHAPVTLDRGDHIEFESLGDFVLEGTGRVSVTQFMVGQNYTSPAPTNGDPAMSLGVPVEQYRTDYTFLAPDTYVINYLTVVHASGAYPILDGSSMLGTGYTLEIDGEWSKTNAEISAGIHHIQSDQPFAITVYGVGSYTSYMYPGGLDLGKVSVSVE